MAEASYSRVDEEYAPVFFAPGEILANDELEARSNAAKAALEQRRKAYRGAIGAIVATKPHLRAQQKWKRFEAAYAELVKSFDAHLAAKDRDQTVAALTAMERAFLAFEEDVADDVLSGPWGFATQQAAEYTANKLRDELAAKFGDQVHQIRSAAEQLLAIKTAGEASGSFDSHVRELAKDSKRSATIWLWALILAWGAGLLAEVYVLREFYTKDDPHLAFAGGLIVAAAVVFILYFVHGQHKVAKMMAIKYEHIKGLVGGGAVNLIGMLGDQDEFRRRVLERLAESFMSLDDVTGALSKTRTPAEDAIQGLKEATKMLVAAKKANE